jgi:chromosome segregation ATPase
MENALAKLQAEQRELRDQVGEQSTSIKQVAEQLELVKEAADRNTQEQRELMEDLRSVRKKVLLFAWIGLGILAISLLVNVILYLHIERILP